MSLRNFLILLLSFSLCVAAPHLVGQAAAATMQGTVTDPDNAVIPGATVTATPRTGAAKIVTSAADGTFSITGLQPGLYSFTVTRPGFATFVQMSAVSSAKPLLCPTCRRPVDPASEDTPFCSDRCRILDLGRWASGDYKISSPILDPDLLEELEHAEQQRHPLAEDSRWKH